MQLLILLELIIDVLVYWASYNLFHIIKIEYLNPFLNMNKTDYFHNSVDKPVDSDNIKNLLFYTIIVAMCIWFLYLRSTKQL